jgi:hypothetical protein
VDRVEPEEAVEITSPGPGRKAKERKNNSVKKGTDGAKKQGKSSKKRIPDKQTAKKKFIKSVSVTDDGRRTRDLRAPRRELQELGWQDHRPSVWGEREEQVVLPLPRRIPQTRTRVLLCSGSSRQLRRLVFPPPPRAGSRYLRRNSCA